MPFGFGSKKRTQDPVEVIGEDLNNGSGEIPVEIQEKISTAPPHDQLTDEQAAQKLKLYKIGALHDPNLPTEEINQLDNALGAHDVGRENALVNDLVENSPYPEVNFQALRTIRIWSQQKLMNVPFYRSALPSAITMSMCPPTPFAPGSLACS
jgi:hypothetical protein